VNNKPAQNKKTATSAIIPTNRSRIRAGHDVYALKDGIIPAQKQMLIDTGIAIGLPNGTQGRLAAGNGMASRQ